MNMVHLPIALQLFSIRDAMAADFAGTLKEVKENPASMMYIVQGAEKEFMIPVVPAFDKGVDWEQKQVLVETIEGMLPDEN
jgi:16S rRNA processing protein RimM